MPLNNQQLENKGNNINNQQLDIKVNNSPQHKKIIVINYDSTLKKSASMKNLKESDTSPVKVSRN